MFTRPKYKVYLISNCIRFGEIKTVTFIIKLDSTNCLIQTDNIHEMLSYSQTFLNYKLYNIQTKIEIYCSLFTILIPATPYRYETIQSKFKR